MNMVAQNLNAMVLEYQTSTLNETIYLPLSGNVNVSINWGDGKSNDYTNSGIVSHKYTYDGTYEVNLTGSLSGFSFYPITFYYDNSKLIKVKNFGNLGIEDLSGAFINAINLVEVPLTLPSSVTNLTGTFSGCTKFNQDISSWDITNVLFLTGMFYDAKSFNQPLGKWNTENVIKMSNMFNGATSFDQNLASWSLKSVNFVTYNDGRDNNRLGNMFVNLSIENYENILIGWAKQSLKVQTEPFPFGAGNSRYSSCEALAAWRKLEDIYGWSISDGGLSGSSCILTEQKDQELLRNINIYPIPSFDFIYFDKIFEAKTVDFFNVESIKYSLVVEDGRINVSHLPRGLYIIKSKEATVKIVLE